MRAGSCDAARAAGRDQSPLAAWFCTRRAGKSRELVREMAEFAATVPDARVIYLNETRAECERIAWLGNGRDGLLTLNAEYQLGGIPNLSKLSMWFPANGGLVEFVGADDKRAVNKLVGIGPHLVIVDEAQKAPHLGHLIRYSLGPAMMDAARTGHQGRIIIAGTPSEDLYGMFYEATRDDGERDTSWAMHSWSVVDNPFFGATPEERYANVVLEYCKTHNLDLDSPEVLRSFGPKWVKGDANYVWHVHRVPKHELCYAPARLRPDGAPDIKACLADLPPLPRDHDWQFTLGADLGFDPDPFAVVIWAWSFGAPAIYELCSFTWLRLLNDDQRDVLDSLEREIGFAVTVADAGGQGKTAVTGWSREWQRRWNKPIIEAKKTRRFEHIELLNSDIRARKVKMRSGEVRTDRMERSDGDTSVRRTGAVLFNEASKATWLAQIGFGKMRENPQTPNDAMDAGLYSHRHTAAYLAQPPEAPRPKSGTPEYYEALERQLEDENDQDEAGGGQESYYG